MSSSGNEKTSGNSNIENAFDKFQDFAKDKTKKLTSPMSVLIYFFGITLLYGFININTIINSSTIEIINQKQSNMMLDFIYIAILLIGTIYINTKISKTICNTNNARWGDIFLITILPWIVVFVLLYFLLEIFPGWVKPFSNTIGYLMVNALGTEDLINKIIKKQETINSESEFTLSKAISNINSNKSKFINEISIDKNDYYTFIKQLSKEGFTNIKEDEILKDINVIKLYSLVISKHLIGKYMWYILAGLLIASISYNNIINLSCDKTIDEYKSQFDKIYSDDKQVIYGNVWEKRNASQIEGKYNANDTYANLITMYSEKFVTDRVTLTTDELNRAGIIYEIPNDIFITIRDNTDIYIPTA